MDKEGLIAYTRNRYPEIDNLSDRTWDEVARAMLCLFDADWKPLDAMALVFKSISGQLRRELSEGLRRALEKNGCEQ